VITPVHVIQVTKNVLHLKDESLVLVRGMTETEENPMDTQESFSDSICEEQMQMAERELLAFINAVKELHGPEQARLSAVDWLDELELTDSERGAMSRWRAVTLAASARLADRLNTGRNDRSFAEDAA
jgi:hypothetical protein